MKSDRRNELKAPILNGKLIYAWIVTENICDRLLCNYGTPQYRMNIFAIQMYEIDGSLIDTIPQPHKYIMSSANKTLTLHRIGDLNLDCKVQTPKSPYTHPHDKSVPIIAFQFSASRLIPWLLSRMNLTIFHRESFAVEFRINIGNFTHSCSLVSDEADE